MVMLATPDDQLDFAALSPEAVWANLREPEAPRQVGSEWIRQMRSRAHILANARRLVAEEGYDSVAMREVARRSGITPPTIYNLIGNRACVLREAIVEGQQAKVAFASRLARSTGMNPILAYAETILNALSCYQDYSRHSIRAIVHQRSDLELPRLITQRSRTAMMFWLDQLERDGRFWRKTCMETAGTLASRPILTAVARWADGGLTIAELRQKMALGVGTVLMGLMGHSESTAIEMWMIRNRSTRSDHAG